MNRNEKLNVGDAVPVDYYMYFVVEKPFEKYVVSSNEKDHGVFYKIGDLIAIIRKQKDFYKSRIERLSDKCRIAIDEEAVEIHKQLNFNACVGNVKEEGSYDVWHFFVIEKYVEEIKKLLDMERDNCYWSLRSEMIDYIKDLCHSDTIWNFCIGIDNDNLFLFTDFYDEDCEDLLNISRKATRSEAKRFSLYVFKVQEEYRRKINEENHKIEEEKRRIYEENKSNPELFPGTGGNYKQVLLEEGRKIVPEKKYSLSKIKKFYKDLLSYEFLSDKVRENMIFYGGTIPYILCNETGNTRNFGDVDIFIPVELMKKFRNDFKLELDYIYDSIKLTEKARLTAKGHGRYFWNYRINSDFESYQDYGFKAVLFGVNISVFPIYDWNFEDGSIGICAKSFRLSKEEGDWNFLLNTIVSKGIRIDNFYAEVSIFEQNVRVAKTEYTIASKRNAIKFGYKLRRETDETDLEYIEAHYKELGIDENQISFFMNNIPDYCISYVYRITRSNNVEIWTPEEYKHCVTREDKPS